MYAKLCYVQGETKTNFLDDMNCTYHWKWKQFSDVKLQYSCQFCSSLCLPSDLPPYHLLLVPG